MPSCSAVDLNNSEVWLLKLSRIKRPCLTADGQWINLDGTPWCCPGKGDARWRGSGVFRVCWCRWLRCCKAPNGGKHGRGRSLTQDSATRCAVQRLKNASVSRDTGKGRVTVQVVRETRRQRLRVRSNKYVAHGLAVLQRV